MSVTRRPTSVGLLPRGKDYSIKDLGSTYAGYTKLVDKELGVSLDVSLGHTRWVGLHELAHVQHDLWTPDRIMKVVKKKLGKDVSHMAVLCACDVRVNELLLRSVPDAHDGFAAPEGHQWRNNVYGYGASHRRSEEIKQSIGAYVDDEAKRKIDAAHKRVQELPDSALTVWGVVVPFALMLDELDGQKQKQEQEQEQPDQGEQGEQEQPEQEQKRGKGKGKGESQPKSKPKSKPKPKEQEDEQEDEAEDADADEDEDSDSDSGDGDEQEDEDSGDGSDGSDEDEDDADEAGDGPGDGDGDGDDDEPKLGDESRSDADFGKPNNHESKCASETNQSGAGPGAAGAMWEWGIPKVYTPELTVVRQKGNRCVTTAETGRSIRWQHSHRLVTDGMVFRRQKRRPGALQRGTVLIDVSGSMALGESDIATMIDLLPHATIAVYSGSSTGGAHLVIVAQEGRSVAHLRYDLVPRGGSNMCDGPALLWLSRMPTPRLWVADGKVNGSKGGLHADMLAECDEIMQAAGIFQVSRAGVTRRLVLSQAPSLEREDFAAMIRLVEMGRVGDEPQFPQWVDHLSRDYYTTRRRS